MVHGDVVAVRANLHMSTITVGEASNAKINETSTAGDTSFREKGESTFCATNQCHNDTKPDPDHSTIAMCMIVKDEEAYLDEFVDYHHALG